MNANDPSKKTSINSLLNPQHDYNYSLRAASWDIEPKSTHPPPRSHYIATQDIYHNDSHSSRIIPHSPSSPPHRFNNSNNYHYSYNNNNNNNNNNHPHSNHNHNHHNSWSHSPPPNHSVHYLPPMYSSESLPNDYPSHGSPSTPHPGTAFSSRGLDLDPYNSTYATQSSLSNQNGWQNSERASIRLAARESIHPPSTQASPDHHPQQQQHDVRYGPASTAAAAATTTSYYPPAAMHQVNPHHYTPQPSLSPTSHSGLAPLPPPPPPSSSSSSQYSHHHSPVHSTTEYHHHQHHHPRSLHIPHTQLAATGQASPQQGQEPTASHSLPRPDINSSDPEVSAAAVVAAAGGAAALNPSSSSRKRSQPDSTGQTEPQPKRAKGKAKTGSEGTITSTGPSRRGYSAEKRSKAAQIAAQNVQMMPTVSYAPVPCENGKENYPNARMRVVTGENGQINGLVTENAIPLQPELQFARCMSNRYRAEQFPRCVSCTRRWAGDTCRFQGIRFFLKDKKRDIVGISFVEGRYQDAPKMLFPTRWNISLRDAHVKRMKLSIAKALLPILKKEHEHIKLPELIRRPRESEVRATCDTCMTSLFTCTWMCRLCGREACAECFSQVKDLTVDKSNANQQEQAALLVRREKHAHSNPFFLSCTRRNEHMAKDFSPVSRFFPEELDVAIPEMEKLLEEEGGGGVESQELDLLPNGHTNGMPELSSSSSSASTSGSSSAGIPTPPPDSSSGAFVVGALGEPSLRKEGLSPSNTPTRHASIATPAYVPPSLPPITASVPYHQIKRYTYGEVTTGDSITVFAPIWQRGDPIVVTGCLEHFKIAWTPEYFVKNYGEQTCLIIECQTDSNKRVTVGQFFDMFGNYEGRSECWKLKDWPPSTDFKTAFPELYRDFSEAVPAPDYVRRDGVGNVGSHFPSNTIAPDLGPKMYNALASNLSEGSKGTTKLHMDMADAVNIMTYTEPCPDGTPGCAAWDLFRACDSGNIRQFLKQKFPKQSAVTDPIHSQQYYLDEVLRKELYDQYGVMSYRVYQRPGEAVFIPAGCAHQVANLADCVKVAIDFVSVENIGRCEGLTREFRELNQRLAWKEDVLQLRSMMWFAWLSCGFCEKGGQQQQQRSETVLSAGNGHQTNGGGGVGGEDDGVGGKKKGKAKKRAPSNVGAPGAGAPILAS